MCVTNNNIKNIHEKITRFWLLIAEIIAKSATYTSKLWIMRLWLTEKQIEFSKPRISRKVMTKILWGNLNQERFTLAADDRIEDLRNGTKTINTSKSTSFWLSVWKTWYEGKSIALEMEGHEPLELNSFNYSRNSTPKWRTNTAKFMSQTNLVSWLLPSTYI